MKKQYAVFCESGRVCHMIDVFETEDAAVWFCDQHHWMYDWNGGLVWDLYIDEWIEPETKDQEVTIHDKIKSWNDSIDEYIEVGLALDLELEGIKVIGGKIPLDKWFKAQEVIEAQGFYERGRELQNELRRQGYDVKMNMQSYKLVLAE